jgi:hypothetical protein
MKKTGIIIGVLALIGGVVYLLYNNKKKNDAKKKEEEESIKVDVPKTTTTTTTTVKPTSTTTTNTNKQLIGYAKKGSFIYEKADGFGIVSKGTATDNERFYVLNNGVLTSGKYAISNNRIKGWIHKDSLTTRLEEVKILPIMLM